MAEKHIWIIPLSILALYTIYHAYGCTKTNSIESDAYIWLRGEVWCGVCKRYERIEYIDVGDEWNWSLFGDALRLLKIGTKNHIDKDTGCYKPFECFAIVNGHHLKHLNVGKHPGCNYDCNGCDEYGWNE